MAKPPFDPNKSFKPSVKKPEFDANKPFESSEKKEMGMLEDAARSTVNALPEIGGVVGGILGTSAGPMGTIGGAGVGGYLGTATKNAINTYIDPENAPKSNTEYMTSAIGGGATQAALEGVGGAVAPYVSKAVGAVSAPVSNALKKVADIRSAKALGLERATFKNLGEEKTRKIGRYALDKGIVSPLATTAKMTERNDALMKKGGEMMGEAYKAIDDQGASTFNPLEVATKIEDKIGKFWRSPLNKAETSQFENTIESVLMRGNQNIPLKEAQVLKEEIAKAANFKKASNLDVTPKEQIARDAYFIISDSIDSSLAQASNIIKQSGLEEKLMKGKDLYSKASGAEKLLDNRSAREAGNKTFGLTDQIWMGAGGATALQNPELAAKMGIAFAGKKAAEKFGNQVLSTGANKLSGFVSKSPQIAKILTAPIVQLKGQDLWMRSGIDKLRLVGEDAEKAASSKEGKKLLLEASDLPIGSKKLELIKTKLKDLGE